MMVINNLLKKFQQKVEQFFLIINIKITLLQIKNLSCCYRLMVSINLIVFLFIQIILPQKIFNIVRLQH
ncbi:unnamed protein product [Paramecium sonneborni]|uniref:Transmembrane protein n=1 Tax=Paramecium sonneborni TaxID=65129 RepID=A0A8S1RUA7_9CILI|nr:unnamed protein product [Paramecium sonneborni]